MSAPHVIVIAGATASGKSAAALGVAEGLGGEIVNADALQLYADLQILTARPDAGDTARAPHHLYGVLGADERASAGWWARRAAAMVAEIAARGRIPILTGGTGLYLKALLTGLSPTPPVSETVRKAAEERLDAIGLDAFRTETATRDPALVARLAGQDKQRLLRAWAVFEATGRPLSEWTALPPEPPLRLGRVDAFVLDPPRATLHARSEARFDRMMADGALEEARALFARDLPPDAPILKAVGLPPLLAHLRGEMERDAAVAVAKRDTRRYVKRQITWFRHQAPDWIRLSGDDPHTAAQAVRSEFLRERAP